jgi:predicted metal-dependent enzyme (double-stranded beta helix superfamily)
VFDVDELVSQCREALAEPQPLLAVKEVVARAVSAPGDVEAALGPPTAGQLTALHRSDDLTVLHVVWPPGVRLFPHDHKMWAANGIYGGHEDNTLFRRVAPGGPIEPSGGRQLDAGDVILLGDDAIHAVTNPRRTWTGAIHVYGGDYFAVPRSQWDPDTLVEEPFDVERVRQVLSQPPG